MKEINEKDLEEMLNTDIITNEKSSLEDLGVKVGIDVSVSKDNNVVSEKVVEEEKTPLDKVLNELKKYDKLNTKSKKLSGELELLNQELDGIISKVKQENKELIDKINTYVELLDNISNEQDVIKENILPIQREIYNVDNEEKKIIYNKITSTYVAPTEKNKFDLKKFREKEKDFWTEHLDIFKPYAKITPVADYIKITVK